LKKPRSILKNLLLLILSVGILLLAVLLILKLVVRWWIPDREFSYNDGTGAFGFPLEILKTDPLIGYANRSGFEGVAYGNVRLVTDGNGFRRNGENECDKKSGLPKIVGLGDSVMFGAVVKDKNTFLRLLQDKLEQGGRNYEVINTGVVGYGTLQEMIFLKERILPLKPEIVLVNYCNNDLLSTEDPFGNMREVYRNYLESMKSVRGESLSAAEKGMLKKIISLFDSAPHIWSALAALNPEEKKLCLKIFVEFPLSEMVSSCRENGIRLIYLFIPPAYGDNWSEDWEWDRWINEFCDHGNLVRYYKNVLKKTGVEYLDLTDNLLPGGPVDPQRMPWEGSDLSRNSLQLLEKILPETFFIDFAKIVTLLKHERIHRRQNYFDENHPTRKGNRDIANEIYHYLMGKES